jgi:hypothetical protein
VAERVVDVFHPVHVGEDDGDAAAIASRMRERDAHAVIEDRPSGETGELVVRQARCPIRRGWRRDLAAVGHETVHRTTWTDAGNDRHRHHHRFARPGDHGELAMPGADAQQRRADLVVIACERLRREQVCGSELSGVAHTETLARGLVEVQHPTLLVDDANQVGCPFRELDQLAGDVRVRCTRRHEKLPAINVCACHCLPPTWSR